MWSVIPWESNQPLHTSWSDQQMSKQNWPSWRIVPGSRSFLAPAGQLESKFVEFVIGGKNTYFFESTARKLFYSAVEVPRDLLTIGKIQLLRTKIHENFIKTSIIRSTAVLSSCFGSHLQSTYR